MSFIQKLKSILPVSYRLFHAHENKTRDEMKSIIDKLNDMNSTLISIQLKQNEASDAVNVLIDHSKDFAYAAECAGEATRQYVNKTLDTQTKWLYDEMERHAHDIAVRDAHSRIFLEAIYREEGETYHEMNERLFSVLPPSKGAVELSQKATAKMMNVLDRLCQYLDIKYWLGYGSLLGAYYCKGPIPWDDDMDICITREDIQKLSEFCQRAHKYIENKNTITHKQNEKPNDNLIAVHNDNVLVIDNTDSDIDTETQHMLELASQYQVSVVYDSYVLCVQTRFSSIDPDLPCFVDLSIYDRALTIDKIADKRYMEIRQNMMRDMRDRMDSGELTYWREHPYIPAHDNISTVAQVVPVEWNKLDEQECIRCENIIENILSEYRRCAIDEGILVDTTKYTDKNTDTEYKGYAFALDNLTDDAPNRLLLWDKENIEPLQKAQYLTYEFYIPHNPEAVITQSFNNAPYLPDDILGHDHYDKQEVGAKRILDKIKEYIDEENE